jgi:hypothetical protein
MKVATAEGRRYDVLVRRHVKTGTDHPRSQSDPDRASSRHDSVASRAPLKRVARAAILAGAFAVVTVFVLELHRRYSVVQVEAEPTRPIKRGVQVTAVAISLDEVKVVDLLPLSEQAQFGVEARFKAHGVNDLEIVPLVTALARRVASSTEQARGLSIELAPETPYRIMAEVLFSASRAPGARLHLLVRPSGSVQALDLATEAPQLWSWTTQSHGAGIFLVTDGVSIKLRGRNVAPGCNDRGPGVAVPKHDGYDWTSLVACFRRLNTVADPPVEEAMVLANPGVPALQLFQASNSVLCGEPSCQGKQIGSPFVRRVVFGIPR